MGKNKGNITKEKQQSTEELQKTAKKKSTARKIFGVIGKGVVVLLLIATVFAGIVMAIQAAVHAGKNHDTLAPGSDPMRTTISGKNWGEKASNNTDYLPKPDYEYEDEGGISGGDKKSLEEDPLNNYKTKDYSK